MKKQFMIESLGWGFGLWLIGYILGFVFFFILPASLIGWVITPIGIVITTLVLRKKIKPNSFQYFLALALIWATIAVVFDYLFIVKMLKPADGYYKLDVYLYYIITFIMPLVLGRRKL